MRDISLAPHATLIFSSCISETQTHRIYAAFDVIKNECRLRLCNLSYTVLANITPSASIFTSRSDPRFALETWRSGCVPVLVSLRTYKERPLY